MIKECVQEALYEEGLLSNVVAEVVKGMHAAPLTETRQPQPHRTEQEKVDNTQEERAMMRAKTQETRRQLMKAIGQDSYNGVDLFEGTQAMSTYEAKDPKPGAVDLGDPNDAGVDISSIMGGATKMWQAMK